MDLAPEMLIINLSFFSHFFEAVHPYHIEPLMFSRVHSGQATHFYFFITHIQCLGEHKIADNGSSSININNYHTHTHTHPIL